MNFNVTSGIEYIGVDDACLDLFESQYPVPRGMTYNSYVILDGKVAVIDTADARVSDEWLANLLAALDGRIPDYLIVQHMEPDHAANIAAFVKMYPSACIVATAAALKMLPQYHDISGPGVGTMAVGDGDTLSLGKHVLRFVTAPMVHWPEVMTVFDETTGVLFSADAFGTFGTMDAQGADWARETRRYYYNICGKYGNQVQALLSKVAALPVRIICPLHGPVLRDNLPYYINLYDRWSRYEPESRDVLVAFASIYGNTASAARELARMLEERGAGVTVVDLSRDDRSMALAEAFRASAMVLASSTYDAGLFPPMETFIQRLASKCYQRRCVGLIENGSWAPAAARKMRAALENMKDIEIVEPVITVRGAMKSEYMAQLSLLADNIVARLG